MNNLKFKITILGLVIGLVIFVVYYFNLDETRNPLYLEVREVEDISLDIDGGDDFFGEPFILDIDSSARRNKIVLKSLIMSIDGVSDGKEYLEKIYVEGNDNIINFGTPFVFDSYIDDANVLGKYDFFDDSFVVAAGSNERLSFVFSDDVYQKFEGSKFRVHKMIYRYFNRNTLYEQDISFEYIIPAFEKARGI